MILSGKEAAEFARKFGAPTPSVPTQPQEKQPGLLTNILRLLANPIKEYGGGVMSGTMGLLGDRGKANQRLLNESLFGSPETNAAEHIAKGTMGMGAYFVPGLQGLGPIAGPAAQGAIGGLLSGASMQPWDENFNLEDVLKAGAFGGALGGAGGAISKYMPKGIGKVAGQTDDAARMGIGERITTQDITPLPTNKVRSFATEEDIAQNMPLLNNIVKGESGKLPSGRAYMQKVAQINKTSGSEIGQKILANKSGFGQGSYVKGMLQKYADNPTDYIEAKELLDDIIKKVNPGEAYIQDAYKLRITPEKMKSIKGEVSRLFKKVGTENGPSSGAHYALRSAINDVVEEAIPEIATLNKVHALTSDYNKVAPAIVRRMTPTANADWTSQVGSKVTQGAKAMIGRGISGVENLLGGNAGKVGKIGKGVSAVGDLLRNPSVQQPVIQTLLGMQGQEEPSQSLPGLQASGDTTDMMSGDIGQMIGMSSPQQYAQQHGSTMLQLIQQNPDLSASQASTIAEALLAAQGITKPAKQSQSAQKQLIAINDAYRDIADLEESIKSGGGAQMGAVKGRLGALGESLGFHTGTAGLSTKINSVAQSISKMLEGGRMTDKDREYYLKNVVPSLRTNPASALEKIQELKSMLEREYQTTSEGYSE